MYRYGDDSNLERLSGTISDLDCFLHRFLDTGFKTKWTGFWVPPYKYLDYYALRVNGIWLDGNCLQYVEYGDQIAYHYETESLKAVERVKTIEDGVGFECSLRLENQKEGPKAVNVTLEAGIDIRSKSEDLGPENYVREELDDAVRVYSGERFLEIEGGETEGQSYIKNHHPGERQRCMVPGEIVEKKEIEEGLTETVKFKFKTGHKSHGRIEETETDYNGKRSYLHGRCIKSVENLVYERNGKGIIAGHPWFQSYWARDSFWSVLGLIDAGKHRLSKEILDNFGEKNLSGKIDLESGKEEYDREDTYPLFVIAAEKLKNEAEISKTIEKTCELAMEELKMDSGIVQHDPEATWMDTLERSPAVDIQSLWLEAAKLRDDPRTKELKSGLEKFMDDEIMKDSLEADTPRAVNFAVPLMFGQVDEARAEKYLSTLNAEFTSRYGTRTRSAMDPGYEADGYHTGAVWGLTTCWAAAANARYGRKKEALNLLDRYSTFLNSEQPGALPELVDAETGELLGCHEQAWSAGMVVHVLESYIDS